MSHSRKHVTDRVLNEFPVPTGNQVIVRTISLRGNNSAEVEDPSGSKYLVMIPQKFNKCVWITRGDYLIVEPFDYKTTGNQALVVSVLYKEQIKHLKTENLWPERFQEDVKPKIETKLQDESQSGEDSLDENPNHKAPEDDSVDDDYSF